MITQSKLALFQDRKITFIAMQGVLQGTKGLVSM